jgi:hypothetical protein
LIPGTGNLEEKQITIYSQISGRREQASTPDTSIVFHLSSFLPVIIVESRSVPLQFDGVKLDTRNDRRIFWLIRALGVETHDSGKVVVGDALEAVAKEAPLFFGLRVLELLLVQLADFEVWERPSIQYRRTDYVR